MLLLYNIFIFVYAGLIHIAAPFNHKARLFVSGRKGQWQCLQQQLQTHRKDNPIVHFHCASVGEFEQGRPIIEEIKRRNKDVQILLTFFSSSGFQACKNYAGADYIFYLPLDFAWNARRFVRTVKPAVSVFIKYEYWHNHIHCLQKSGAKCYLVSAIFRPKQVFFLPLVGNFFRKILRNFTIIFVQNQRSLELLQPFGFKQIAVSGDTRFDRVVAIASQPKSLPVLEKFAQGQEVLVAGSTWEQDEALLAQIANNDEHLRIVFVPHELHEHRIKKLMQQLQKPAVRYSQLVENPQLSASDYHYIVVDCIGILSSAYKIARYAYIGGGFGVGIHNTLEAAVYGIPLFFGENYHKFKEAQDLIALGGAFCVKNFVSLQIYLDSFRQNPTQLTQSGEACKNYVQQNVGATQQVCNSIISKKL
ncbi:3-deoxy-D-manno-octulosonic acid transferase [Bacteroidia bacterium]|nr:3-deoxy-D-manno-octulosonic acid transferase [Bacteroidia bacterium]